MQIWTIEEQSVYGCFEEAKMKTLQCSKCVTRKNITENWKGFGIAGEERHSDPK